MMTTKAPAGKPPFLLTGNVKRRNVRQLNRREWGMPDYLTKKLADESERLGIDESEVVRMILTLYFERK